MDYKAYHQALMLGFSESEATRIGEYAYLDNMRLQNASDDRVPVPLCDICGTADAVTTTNNYYVCSEQCHNDAISKIADINGVKEPHKPEPPR